MWSTKTPHILIIEDSKANHPLFEKAFRDAGFDVTLERTADGDFVSQVLEVQPDIISMDIMIGKSGADVERDGLAAAALLKGDERTADLPIIFLTNFVTDEKVLAAKAIGAVDFLSLQGNDLSTVPKIFSRYLDNPRQFVPTHPLMRVS